MRTTLFSMALAVLAFGFVACDGGAGNAENDAVKKTEEANKQLSNKLFAVWGGGDVAVVSEVVAENHKMMPGEDPMFQGLEGYTMLLTDMQTAFPDAKCEVIAQLAEGDKVCTVWRYSGTNTGAMMGGMMPATGKTVEFTGSTVEIYKDGKLVETWSHMDQEKMMTDMGMMPDMSGGEHDHAGHDHDGHSHN